LEYANGINLSASWFDPVGPPIDQVLEMKWKEEGALFHGYCSHGLHRKIMRARVYNNINYFFFLEYISYIELIRFLAISQYFSSISIPMKLRLSFLQATATVPEPIKGSRTTSPGTVNFSI